MYVILTVGTDIPVRCGVLFCFSVVVFLYTLDRSISCASMRPGSAPPTTTHPSQRGSPTPLQTHDASPPGSPFGGPDEGVTSALAVNGLWPISSHIRPRFATQYARDSRLQQIHLIYGQYIGGPRPAAPHAANRSLAGGYGAILVGDYFPMPTSPHEHRGGRGRPTTAPNHRRPPQYKAAGVILDEANQLAERPLQS